MDLLGFTASFLNNDEDSGVLNTEASLIIRIMKDSKFYIVSFGDSDKYSVPFDGSKEEFEKSGEFKHIKDDVFEYVKSKFPAAKFEELIAPKVEDPSQRDEVYPVLDSDNLGKLKHDVARQVEVKMQDKDLNSDAPYSNI